MIRPSIVFYFLLVFLLSACSHITVTSKQLSEYDWPSAKTYAWAGNTKISATEFPEVDTASLNKLIKESVEHRLSERGLKKVHASKDADLIVTYLAAIRTNVEVHKTPKYYNEDALAKQELEPAYNAYMWAAGSPKVVEYTEGTVAVILKDAKTGTDLWQGIANSVVDFDTTRSERAKKIESASRKMFANFPD